MKQKKSHIKIGRFLLLFSFVCILGSPQLVAAQDAALEAEVSVDTAAESSSAVTLGATPTLLGPSGLFHIASAQTGDVMTFRLGMFAQYFSSSDVVRTNDENTRFIGSLNVSMTPLDWLEPYLVLMARSNNNTFSAPETVLAQGDIVLGSKAVYEVERGLHLGGDFRLMFLTGPGTTSFDFGATSVKASGLATYDGTVQDESLPLKAHLNLGVFVDNSDQILPEDDQGRKLIPNRVERFAQNTSAFNQIQLGVGLEFPLERVTPHIEYNLGVLFGDEPPELCNGQALECPSAIGFAGNPQTLTVGLKGMPLEGLVLNGGVDIGLNSADVQGVPATAPYNLMFGLSYVFDPRPKIVEKFVEKERIVEVSPPVGLILGTVVDADTGKPVAGAMISYPERELTTQAVDAKTGAFQSYALSPPPTGFQLKVSHPDYKTVKLTKDIVEGENAFKIKLKPIGKTGQISGTVSTPNGTPASGKVSLIGTKKSYTVSLKKGAFSQKVLVGSYTVAIRVEGFLTAGTDVKVKSGSKRPMKVKLKPRPSASSVSLSGNKILIDGKIMFNDDNTLDADASGAILDEVASVMFEHPEFSRVRVESHIDDRGTANDQREKTDSRAKGVFNALLKRGVSASRLESKGFGSELPLVPNTSKGNRSINRRVEFTIISKAE